LLKAKAKARDLTFKAKAKDSRKPQGQGPRPRTTTLQLTPFTPAMFSPAGIHKPHAAEPDLLLLLLLCDLWSLDAQRSPCDGAHGDRSSGADNSTHYGPTVKIHKDNYFK